MNWIQVFVFHCAELLIATAVQLTVDSCNVVNWIQKIVLNCAVLLIVIAVQQKVDSCNVVYWIQKNCIALCCAVNSDSGTADSG